MQTAGFAHLRSRSRVLAIAVLGLAMFGGLECGAPDADLCRPSASERISEAHVEHACLHTTLGPFQDVVAVLVDGQQSAPELRNTHTAYNVTLQPRSSPPLGDRYEGRVRLRPRASGVYALYLKPELPVRVTNIDGESLCILEIRDGGGCPGIASSQSVRLVRLSDYVVTLGPSPQQRISLVLELLYEDGLQH